MTGRRTSSEPCLRDRRRRHQDRRRGGGRRGRLLEELRVESPAADAEAMEDAIAGLVTELRLAARDRRPSASAPPGYVDKDRARVLFAPNLAWRDVPLKDDLEERIDLPVVVENDANAAAWGEFTFGAGHDVDDLLLVTVGTGVGGGLVLDGSLYRGAFGVAAEIGHLRVVPEGIVRLRQPRLPRAVRERQRAGARGPGRGRGRTPPARSGCSTGPGATSRTINGPMVTEAAHARRRVRGRAARRARPLAGRGDRLADRGARPGVVAIGGGVSEAGDLLLDPAREAFAAHAARARAPARSLEIRPGARSATQAGMIGAADLSRR